MAIKWTDMKDFILILILPDDWNDHDGNEFSWIETWETRFDDVKNGPIKYANFS